MEADPLFYCEMTRDNEHYWDLVLYLSCLNLQIDRCVACGIERRTCRDCNGLGREPVDSVHYTRCHMCMGRGMLITQ